MTRQLAFNWHLRRLMAGHNMWKTTDLAPLLHERGVNLSPAQVYRLVTDKPERLSMRTLVALCDIFDCTPNDLVEPHVQAATGKKTAGASTEEGTVAQPPTKLRPAQAQREINTTTDTPPQPTQRA